MPIRPLPTKRATRSRWPRQGPPPSRIGARCSWSRRLRCGGCRASSGSSRPATSGATSCPAPIAVTGSGCSSRGCAGARESPRRQCITAKAARSPSPSTTRRRCWPMANGGRLRSRPIHMPSASTSRPSIRRSAGRAGSRSHGTGWPPKARTRCCVLRATRCWARPGSRAAKRRNGSASRIGALLSRRRSPHAGCS